VQGNALHQRIQKIVPPMNVADCEESLANADGRLGSFSRQSNA